MFFDTSALADGEIALQLVETVEANPEKRWAPAYRFAIRRSADGALVGRCDFRVGHTERLYFGGNIGYAVDEPYRGNHYAGKACRLLLGLARQHGMDYLYITCSPHNAASRRTCEYAGGKLQSTIPLPTDNDLFLTGEWQICLYYFDLSEAAGGP
ncbi:MAG: GNAT family N-acetyltransferase [Clostridiales bacterium]|nr:GNAT family N-acetyltransferase [Clostridiales bacterium]